NTIVQKYMDNVVTDDTNDRKRRSETLKKLRTDYQTKLKGQRQHLRQLAVNAGSDDKQTLAFKNQLAHETLAHAKDEQLRIRSELARTKAEAAALDVVKPESESRLVPDGAIETYVEQDPTVIQVQNRIS